VVPAGRVLKVVRSTEMRHLGLVVCLCAGACASGAEGFDKPDAPLDGPLIADAFTFPDVLPRPDAYHAIDASVLQDFGGMCGDRGECKSGICLLSAAGGYCSTQCNAGTCPPGYGCLGVTGAIEPGQVSNVCVKDYTLLCTPCSGTVECGASGENQCIASASGGSFCGRDCTSVSCPTGYSCTKVAPGDAGVASMQCVPTSGACDCGPAQMGMTKGCSLPTPLGTTCAGQRTCMGAAGWSDCKPPSTTDVPDGNFADENCDGIDGDVTDGIFVASEANGGTDSDACGLRYDNPCGTITNGTRRAKVLGKHFVYVQAGVYNEAVILRDGVSVFGGYDSKWQRASRTTPLHDTRITGVLYTTDDQFVGIVAHNLTSPTTVGDLWITGGNATGSSGGSGRSSYGVHASSASALKLDRMTINAGQGAPGAHGGDGTSAPLVNATMAMKGGTGGDFDRCGGIGCPGCDSSVHGGGGTKVANQCGAYTDGDTTSGKGGNGGTKDTYCGCGADFWNCNYDNTPGSSGDNAPIYLANQYGGGGAGGGTCAAGTTTPAGAAGRVANGAGGAGGLAGGRIVNDYWYANRGETGHLGKHGGGGGGGGGAGGCDTNSDTAGSGGGAGGAGGCAASGGGIGGEGGGGSFGVFVYNSTVAITDVDIQLASSGRAGDGGLGGQGQSGGDAGDGGRGSDTTPAGGQGGRGGHGGHGGGGGGGSGGVSVGLYTASAAVTQTRTTIHGSAVAPGDGGLPGGSAPNAPVDQRDGQSGQPGSKGYVANSFDCKMAAACGTP
jgi:hypothetical protein